MNNLLQHKEANRLKSIDHIFEFLKNNDNAQKEYYEREEQFNTLKIFDDIIDKYTPNILYGKFKMFDNTKDINDILTDLSINCKKLNLWWSQGYFNNTINTIDKYYSISFWDKCKEKIKQNTKWILGNFELNINSIWIYKYGDLGGSFIIIESKPMESFGIFKNKYEIEEVVLLENRYIPKTHYDNGWTEHKGNRLRIKDKCELRIRHLYKDIFFIAPWAGSIITNNSKNTQIINDIYERYRQNSTLNESFLAPLKNLRRKDEIAIWS